MWEDLAPSGLEAQPAQTCRQVLRPGHYTPSSDPLLCAQESIKSSQQWFIACGPSHAPALVALLARRLMALPSYDKQLHVVYLANDIHFKALQGRQPPGFPAAQDPVASAFLPALGPMLAAAYQRGGRTAEVRLRGREGGCTEIRLTCAAIRWTRMSGAMMRNRD